jgi:hypothetical protein
VDTSAYQHETSITIERSPEELYDLVADVSQMGRWSPVCTGGAYDADRTWFTGTNQMGDATWETRCRVAVAQRGREFAFVNHGRGGNHALVRWGFRFRGIAEGRTEVTQSWSVLPTYPDGLGLDDDGATQVLDRLMHVALRGMPDTLAALKADAEARV